MKQRETKMNIRSTELHDSIMSVFHEYMQEQKKKKVKIYKYLNQYVKKRQILLVGSSLMENFPINELLQSLEKKYIIYNRGIGGYVTEELLSSMEECIFELEPVKIFINIGTNDISAQNYEKERLIDNYNKILTKISERLPNCTVYVMAYYPVNAKADFTGVDKARKEELFRTRTNSAIFEANAAVEEIAKKHGYEFINVNKGLTDEDGNLKVEYAIEGLHMWPNAYKIIFDNLLEYL